jgi:hypothetical protein
MKPALIVSIGLLVAGCGVFVPVLVPDRGLTAADQARAEKECGVPALQDRIAQTPPYKGYWEEEKTRPAPGVEQLAGIAASIAAVAVGLPGLGTPRPLTPRERYIHETFALRGGYVACMTGQRIQRALDVAFPSRATDGQGSFLGEVALILDPPPV